MSSNPRKKAEKEFAALVDSFPPGHATTGAKAFSKGYEKGWEDGSRAALIKAQRLLKKHGIELIITD